MDCKLEKMDEFYPFALPQHLSRKRKKPPLSLTRALLFWRPGAESNRAEDVQSLATKHEIDSPQQTQACPDVIGFEWLAHVKNGEGYEDSQRDDLLRDLQLRQ